MPLERSRDFDVANPQVFGQAKGVALVVFRSPASPHADHDDFLHMGCQNFVKPARVGSFFEDESAVLGNGLQEADQGFGVGLQNLTLQFPATGAEDSSGAA